jgi:hypothetical protein
MPSICFLLAKKQTDKEVQSIKLELQDFTASEIHEHFQYSRSTLVETKYSPPVMVLAKPNIK